LFEYKKLAITVADGYLQENRKESDCGNCRYETVWDYSQEIKEKDENYFSEKEYNLESKIEKYFNVYLSKKFLMVSENENLVYNDF
jgi:hypothetical protein